MPPKKISNTNELNKKVSTKNSNTTSSKPITKPIKLSSKTKKSPSKPSKPLSQPIEQLDTIQSHFSEIHSDCSDYDWSDYDSSDYYDSDGFSSEEVDSDDNPLCECRWDPMIREMNEDGNFLNEHTYPYCKYITKD